MLNSLPRQTLYFVRMADKQLLILVMATFFAVIQGEDPKAYNTEIEICCNGVVFNEDPAQSCCGSHRYNNAEQQCCGEFTHGISNNNIDCCYNDENDSQVPYVKISDICCNGKVWKRRRGRRGRDAAINIDCCGSVTYNTETQICCNENDIRYKNGNEPDLGCCVSETYNTLTHMCCKDTKLINGTKMIEFALIPLNNISSNSSSNTMQCCRTIPFDPEESICCTGGVVDRPLDRNLDFVCCGKEIITDLENELCCGDKIHKKAGNHTECCGLKTVYNKEKHICCGQNIFSKTNVTMKCCQSIERLYDPKKEMCCRTGLVTLSQEDVQASKTSCCEVEHPEYKSNHGFEEIFRSLQ